MQSRGGRTRAAQLVTVRQAAAESVQIRDSETLADYLDRLAKWHLAGVLSDSQLEQQVKWARLRHEVLLSESLIAKLDALEQNRAAVDAILQASGEISVVAVQTGELPSETK